MIWQDVVIAFGQTLFAIALVPALRSKTQKPPVSTCVMTAVALIGFAVAYGSMSLWSAASSVLLCASGWLWLAGQQRRTGLEDDRFKRMASSGYHSMGTDSVPARPGVIAGYRPEARANVRLALPPRKP